MYGVTVNVCLNTISDDDDDATLLFT